MPGRNRLALAAVLVMLMQACAMRPVEPPALVAGGDECVVLLHGLVRTSNSMAPLQRYLATAGYTVENQSYPSREKRIELLAQEAVVAGVQRCRDRGLERVNFVTHSMGGILVRYYLEHQQIENLGRVVMISPPNQGSELVDFWSRAPGYRKLHGPAGYQLGTGADSLPLMLGPANFDVGVITGNNTTNLIFSLMIPGEDDGKVSVECAKLEGMADFLVVPEAHSLIMRDREVMRQVVTFLDTGQFDHRDAGQAM
jgi:pimeloyl-ACP methyl ester carboxylesterase